MERTMSFSSSSFSRRFVAALGLMFVMATDQVWASSDADPASFVLTPAMLDRMAAVTAELGTVQMADDSDADDNDDDDESDAADSVEDLARRLNARPEARAALARHGLSSQQYVSATLAVLHAGMYLAVEQSAGPQALASFTAQQRANVEVVRAHRKK
ncbi:hypothetical protein CAL20_04315 [Bordetella genomosp. 4]|uniref:Uncharacterized protein n=2 Tax=Bordetella genomosp. 4 TaxID=463044 RepID=A0A261UVE8_9BORD|nr:hypothetical protein CAL21_01960 [Bordetella genomosp. 4]OZI64873.1 hypothetical protein CAL20_04315 [Bordetella genomosp. 4]